MGIPEIRARQADLERAITILEEGREGASDEWVKAATTLVDRCRLAYEQARRDSGQSDFPQTLHPQNHQWGRAELWSLEKRSSETRPH